ncbi:bifunctional UDP-N-acetylglucosamine diphosphorylase/glucosamine-1-phosphate N-acetyltransferase GlmU [Candidatus Bandiella euplotis]|nr:bifunctional UDP-N-acetylglucosamine diphosphorylase/glucosamine-1-phosphate N-acetyltransferase GlmU [Candidatus Bandiella woodruffii]
MQAKFEPTIIILSAGNGERMNSSTPKVLHEVAQQALIKYVLELSGKVNSGCANAHIVINRELEGNKQFQEICKQYQVKTIIQQERLGTGDAVKTACDSIDALRDLVLILYGDTPFIKPSSINAMAEQIEKGADIVIIGFNAQNPTGYGRIVSTDGNRVEAIVEENETTEVQKSIRLCNSGILLVKKDVLLDFLVNAKYNRDKEFYLTDIVGCTKNKICTYIVADEEEVMGINDRKQLYVAEKYMQKVIVEKMIELGGTIIKPETSYFAADILISRDVVIYPNVFIGKDTVIKSHARIHSFSHIEGGCIDEHAIIGPFARIRPNTQIGSKSKIGNFVEVKNSTIMEGVKAGHLSYIGDATIDNDVNIGAGTVFCNYDGSKKHHSKVGEKSFIGSNTSIISPVIIKNKATIAAGSVITKDVDENDLAVARARQLNIKNKSKIK